MRRLPRFVSLLALCSLPVCASAQIDLTVDPGSNWDVTAILEGSVFPSGPYTETDSAMIPLTGTMNVTLTPAVNPTLLTINSFTFQMTQTIDFDLDAGTEGVQIFEFAPNMLTKGGGPTQIAVSGGTFAPTPIVLQPMEPYIVDGDGALDGDFPNSVLPVISIVLSGSITNNGSVVMFDATIAPQSRTYNGTDGDLTFQHTGDILASAIITTGACCLPDGSCVTQTAALCTQAGGTYQGDNVDCANVNCPQPPSPCCLPDGTCDVMPDADCESLGGTVGPGADCTGIVCVVVEVPSNDCPCELDGNAAQIDVQDLLAFLACWFPASDGAACP